jgi:hypothetical protein
MPAKKPLNTQPTNRLLDVSTLANSPYEKIFNPQSENIPIQQSNVFNKTSIVPQKQIQRAPSAMPNQNVVLNAGIQMLPEEQMPEEPSDDSSNFLGSLIAQGITGIGTGLMGGDSYDIMRSANVFQNMRDRQANEKRAKLLTDPKSEESKRRRLVFEKALKFKIPEEYSYTDLNDPVVLQSIRDKNMQAIAPKGGIGGARGGVGQVKDEKESKDQKEVDMYTSTANTLQRQLNEYRKAIKAIPITGGAAEIAKAEALGSKILLNVKLAEKTGSLDDGSIKVIQGMIGTPDYTQDKVVDARIDQGLKIINDNVENEIRGRGLVNKYYQPFIPYDASEEEKQIINNYYKNPNDPTYSKLFNDLRTKREF